MYFTHRNAHASRSRDQPTPHRRRTSAGLERIDESGRDGGEQAANTDGEGEGRQVPELALEDGLVSKLGGQSAVGVAHVFQVDGSSLAAWALDDQAAFALAQVFGEGVLHDGGALGEDGTR